MAEEQTKSNAAAPGDDTEVDLKAVREKADKEGRERLEALSEAFPDDPQFVLEQFKAGATLEQAKAAYADVLTERLAESNAEIAKLQKGKDETDTTSRGAPPLKGSQPGQGSSNDFIEAAKQLAEDKKISMTEAMKRVKKDNPELYEEHITQSRQQAVA